MKENTLKLPYYELWKDICFFDVYQDCINFDCYIKYLSNKYNVSTNEILLEMDKAFDIAFNNIKRHHLEQEDILPLQRTECEEESIRTLLEYNKEREEIKEEFGDTNNTKALIRSINKLGW